MRLLQKGLTKGRGEITTEGAVRLAEAILTSWRKDYTAALNAYRKKRTQKKTGEA